MHSNDRMFGNDGDTMLLHAARELAREDNEDWCIVLHEGDLHVAKLSVADRLQFVRVVHDDGTVLRFSSIRDAWEFLKNELSVPRAAVYLEDVHRTPQGKRPGNQNPQRIEAITSYYHREDASRL